jgi:acyl-CoA thioester hydrolase
MDALAHLNNTRYFEYCGQVRIKWLEEIGYIDYLNGKSETGPVVINAGCTFHRQVVYPCRLKVSVFVGDVGRSSIQTWYEIIGIDDGVVRTTGAAKIVWVDYAAEKSVPLPDDIRAAVETGD